MKNIAQKTSEKNLPSIAETGRTLSNGFISHEAEIDFNRKRAAYLANARTVQYGGKQ
jgi:hypothetical protein